MEETEEGSVLNVEKFNNEHKEWGRILPITNEKNRLVFIVMFTNSPKMLFYNNGKETDYIIDDKREERLIEMIETKLN